MLSFSMHTEEQHQKNITEELISLLSLYRPKFVYPEKIIKSDPLDLESWETNEITAEQSKNKIER